MTTRPLCRVLLLTALAAALALAAGCSKKEEQAAQATTPSNVTLTADQRQRIHIYTVTPSRFHKTVETSGMVDFDNDQATSVLAPVSGPVTRLLVSPTASSTRRAAPPDAIIIASHSP